MTIRELMDADIFTLLNDGNNHDTVLVTEVRYTSGLPEPK